MGKINSSKKPVGNKSSKDLETLSSSSSLVLHESHKTVPIVSSYNDKIRPLLDAIDKLRHLNVAAKEGIQLPTIVVVGDQSSGKSSVLESLAGISLPRGQGICTRVPLIMRLHHHSAPTPVLSLEYSFNGSTKTVPTDETSVAVAINTATEEIAGAGKGISNNPLTLIVRKNGVPDLTMVDLPGITRVPVHGQPEDIYEQVTETIMEYIKPEESIILNVLSATVDFSTCESIRMSQKVDKTGDRTLAVVTKVDKSPEGLLEKVMADDVQLSTRRTCHSLISRMRERSVNWVNEVLEMEMATDYTCNPEYLIEWNKLLAHRPQFITSVKANNSGTRISIADFGVVTVGHAVKWSMVLEQAYDLRMRIVTYWKIVRRRLVDAMGLHIQLCVRKLVDKELEKELVDELMGSQGDGGIERVLEESSSVAAKREKLNGSIGLLKESKEVLATIIDKIASAASH
ncbi:Putative dynamin-related protein 4A [Linum perenne]